MLSRIFPFIIAFFALSFVTTSFAEKCANTKISYMKDGEPQEETWPVQSSDPGCICSANAKADTLISDDCKKTDTHKCTGNCKIKNAATGGEYTAACGAS